MAHASWPRPAEAVEVHPPEHLRDHDRWVADRGGGIGGSDIAALLGWGITSPFQLWLEKTGRVAPEPDTYLMERGRRFETACAQWFADESGLSCLRTGTWARVDHPYMRATPDRFTSDGGGYEGKIVGEDWGRHWKFGPALPAWAQCQWGMAVTGLDRWYLAAAADNWFRWWIIDRNKAVIIHMMDAVESFWHRHVLGDVPPPVDGSVYTAEVLQRAYPYPTPTWRCFGTPAPLSDSVEVPGLTELVRRRRQLMDQRNLLEKQLKAVNNELRAAMGNARVGTDGGRPVITRVMSSRTGVRSGLDAGRYPELYTTTTFTNWKELV